MTGAGKPKRGTKAQTAPSRESKQFPKGDFSTKRVAFVVATVAAAIGGLASPANADGPGYGYWGGYTLGYYRDDTP
jgi:hypothetical protein